MVTERSLLIGILSLIAGVLLGTCVLLAAKILYPPPVDPMDQEFLPYLGDAAPPFELPDLDGNIISNTQFAEKDYLLFWGEPHCEACWDAYPMLKHVAAQVPTLMISVGDRAAMRQKQVEHGLSFPIAFDSLKVTQEAFHVKGYPTVMLIDRKGRIRKATSGNVMTVKLLAFAEESLR